MFVPVKKVKEEFQNFPTKWQTVIFRNYGLVCIEKIAEVLGCDATTVKAEAARLGLTDVPYDKEWETRGYLTVIRNNWNLLPYAQLMTLLGVTEAELDFYLEKEDFLYVKLGEYKPDCETVRYAPLTEAQKSETERIAQTVKAYSTENKKKAFDFFSFADKKQPVFESEAGTRIVHGYLSPCGDVFAVDSESYLPDELLAEYARQGVNGLWLHGLLSNLAYYPFDESLCVGYEKRREKLKALIARGKKYGIKIYLYFNEPRGLAQSKFGKYAHLMGRTENGNAALCLEKEEVKAYLYEAVKDLLTDVNGLGGIITITMSENLTHCNYRPDTDCPICKHIPPEKSAAEVNNIMMKAVRDSGSDAELIANLWGWSQFMEWTEEQTLRGVELLDKDISVLCVSEYDLAIEKGGVKSRIIDYSVSNPGPSEITKKTLKKASETGHKLYAKIQINNSWECSAVPYLPVFDLLYEHLKNLAEINVQNYMLTWTLGGYPSPMMDMTTAFAEEGDTFNLTRWYQNQYGENAEKVHSAVEKFCQGFREYPFSIESLYYSPKTLGIANLWDIEPSEKISAMVCYGYDDYENWIKPYPYEVYVSQYEKLLQAWGEGLDVLNAIASTPQIRELQCFAQAAYLHFKADLLQTRFSYYKREKEAYKQEILGILEEQIKDAGALLKLINAYPAIGFEASNHYFYTDRNILEKILNLQAIQKTL